MAAATVIQTIKIVVAAPTMVEVMAAVTMVEVMAAAPTTLAEFIVAAPTIVAALWLEVAEFIVAALQYVGAAARMLPTVAVADAVGNTFRLTFLVGQLVRGRRAGRDLDFRVGSLLTKLIVSTTSPLSLQQRRESGHPETSLRARKKTSGTYRACRLGRKIL